MSNEEAKHLSYSDSDETKTQVVKNKAVKPVTRSYTEVWLVGQLIEFLDFEHFKQLPMGGQVLRRLFFDLKVNKLSLSISCSTTIDEVLTIWHAANIPTTQKPNAVYKLKALYERHVSVGKNKARRTNRQIQLENEFSECMQKLFDISHANSAQLIRIEEDLQFLEDQRQDRKMTMGEEDLIFRKKEESKALRKSAEIERRDRLEKSKKAEKLSKSVGVFELDETSAPDVTTDEEDELVLLSQYHQRQLTFTAIETPSSTSTPNATITKMNKRCLIDDPLFVASLDRTNTTPRQAMHIIAPALKAAGVKVNDLTLCTTSLYEARKKTRLHIDEGIRGEFCPSTPLVAHFDGKLLPDNDGATSDRLPVVVSGKEIEKLLAIPKLPGSGTGIRMGNKVVEILRQWEGVPQWIAGLCFDTTSANTGVHNGAITVIQRAFDKRILFLACRHHMFEIIATAVFDLFFVSSGPQIAIFARLKDSWPFIDQSSFAPITKSTKGFALTDSEKIWLEQSHKDVAEFLCEQLSRCNQPRHDYLEFIKLSLIALDETSCIGGGDSVHFSPPGAYHRARWMAKGIYCLKILLFREQFKMNDRELQAIRRICLFTITLYVKAWFTAPVACDAPYNDLCLLQRLETYQGVDSQVAEVALGKMKAHLWYLSEDLAGLSIFSGKVFAAEKRSIVSALSKTQNTADLRRVDAKIIQTFQDKTLSDFVTQRSMNLFTAFKLSQNFLPSDPETWNSIEAYCHAKNTVDAIRVVNDCAERAVKLATDFNLSLTHDEEQRQVIFQVVEHHRKLIINPLKKNFCEN